VGVSTVNLVVNGVKYTLEVSPSERLLDTLRWRLGLTSVKEGCGRGECGYCIVLVNGKPRHSCLTLTATLNGAEVTTLEGLAPEGSLHAIQVALLEVRGIQCGFCIPGLVMVLKALLDHNSSPSEEEIREWIASVLCRCGSYHYYVEAAKRAAEYLRSGRVYFSEREVREKLTVKAAFKR
jgi:carbon-monoxide dehydrogenase small subunit